MNTAARVRGRIVTAVAACLSLALPAVAAATTSSSVGGQARIAVRDGSSEGTAVASCWEAKQAGGDTSGLYWLQTPAMVAPQQFHCDQRTDGGGWVLVARGRNGWGWSQNGQGTRAQLLAAITGRAAFVPRALSAETISGLLDGASPVNLADGIRLRRARTNSGSRWQEVRLQLAKTTTTGQPAQPWSWAMPGGMPLREWRVAAASGTGKTTAFAGTGSEWSRVSTTPDRTEGFTQGFAYGVRALSGSSNGHLFRTGAGRTFPFTQVYLRPRLLSGSLTYPALPDSGTPATRVDERPANLALPQAWGVAGSADGRTTLYNDEILAMTQSGSHMVVGGNFKRLQRGASGVERIRQSYLAAFHAQTAEPVREFRPVFNGQVKALETLPSGLVVAGGEFTRVNGVRTPGIVALDPTTGRVDPGWRVRLEQRTSNRLFVRSLERYGNRLYIGGSFTHISSRADTTPSYARNAARVRVGTGRQDTAWRPAFNGSVNDISVAPDGSRVYLVGTFSQVSGSTANKVAVLSATDARRVSGLAEPTFSKPTVNYQQGVVAIGNRVFYGGAQHMLFGVDAQTFRRTSATVTLNGGDFQAVTSSRGLVLAGCHCERYSYQDATTYPRVAGWSRVAMIRYVGAWDPVTGEHISGFYPEGISTRASHGAWAIETGSDGTVWVGGDFTGVRSTSGRTQWTGGFFRLPQRDTSPPTAPTGLVLRQSVQDPSLLNVDTTASTDGSGRPVAYEVLAGDRVVDVRNGRSGTIPMPPAGTRIAVRAVDREGNRSASTPVQHSPAPR